MTDKIDTPISANLRNLAELINSYALDDLADDVEKLEYELSAAKAEIERLREPTDAMLLAGWKLHHPPEATVGGPPPVWQSAIRKLWRAMYASATSVDANSRKEPT